MIKEYQNKLKEQSKHRYVSSLPVVRISSSSSKLLLNNSEHDRKRHQLPLEGVSWQLMDDSVLEGEGDDELLNPGRSYINTKSNERTDQK